MSETFPAGIPAAAPHTATTEDMVENAVYLLTEFETVHPAGTECVTFMAEDAPPGEPRRDDIPFMGVSPDREAPSVAAALDLANPATFFAIIEERAFVVSADRRRGPQSQESDPSAGLAVAS